MALPLPPPVREASPFGASPAEAAPAAASPFGTPCAEAIPAPAAESPFGAPPTKAASPFQSELAASANGPASSFGAPPAEAAALAPAPADPLFGLPNSAAQAAPAAELAAPPAAAPGLTATIPSAVDPAAAALAARPASQTPGIEFGFEADPKQLVLRALFGVETALNAEDVLGRLTNIDGLEACVLIEKQSGNTRATSGKDAARTSSFEAQAKQAYQKVISLADDLSVTDAESFTLRTTYGAMSFFNASAACLAVLQQDGHFEAGVRERLTLVTRELSEML